MRAIYPGVLSLILLTLFAGAVIAATLSPPQKDYSADFLIKVTEGGGAPMTIPGKIYYSKGKERRESESMGQKSISISRPDKNVLWILMPEKSMYMEQPLGDKQAQKDPMAVVRDDNVEITRVGSERVNGVKTDKYRMTSTDSQAESMEGFLWLSKENIPIRMEGTSRQRGHTTHFVSDTTNLKIGRLSSSLFEIPSGYQRLQIPSFGGLGMGMPSGKSTMQPDAPQEGTGGMNLSPEQMKQFQMQMEQLKKQMGNQ
jgi:outer membrane lipoprotein-sorting protein